MFLTETPALRESSQRRAWRLLQAGPQLRLGLYVLAIALFFGGLVAFNSYAAFGALFSALLAGAPRALEGDVWAQTDAYVQLSLVIFGAYALSVLALCIGYLHRLIGPTVALERQVRALRWGDYSVRIRLREGEVVYADLARQLNGLAEKLERQELDNARRAKPDRS